MIEDKLECLTNTVKEHGTDIGALKIENVKLSSAVDGMSKQLEKLNDNLKWLIRTLTGAVVAGVISVIAALIT